MLRMPAKAVMQVVPALRDQMLQSLKDEDVVIDASDIAEADLSLVQTIESARHQARCTGRAIHLAEPANAVVTDVLRRAGFLADPSYDDVDFWFHGGLPQ